MTTATKDEVNFVLTLIELILCARFIEVQDINAQCMKINHVKHALITLP